MAKNFRIKNIDKTISNIQKGFSEKAFKTFSEVVKELAGRLRALIGNAIRASSVYRDIDYELGGELGFLDGRNRLDSIINDLVDGIVFDVKQTKVGAQLIIYGLKSNYTEILENGAASFITEQGDKLEWLRWLLTEGTSPIVIGYHFTESNVFNDNSSRTGYGLMKKRGNWSISEQYAGTQGDNFLTRAIETVEPELKEMLKNAILRRLK